MTCQALKFIGAVSTVVFGLLAASPPAWGVTSGVDRDVLAGTGGADPGNADFGSGFHANGVPTGPYTVSWDYTAVNGVVVVTARVSGTLYVDRLGGGCSRLLVNFQDINFTNLFATQSVQFCGPGFDANNTANQRAVGIVSPADSRIRHVQLVIGSGATTGQIQNDRVTTEFFPIVTVGEIINSGTADLGGAGPILHVFGAPVNPYSASILLQDNGVVRGHVNGILFWDSTLAGTACAIVDFKSPTGAILATSTISVTAPSGGNALQTSNQKSFDRAFSNASLFAIRLRVGTGTGAATAPCSSLTGVTTKNYTLGPAVGAGVGVPFVATANIRDETAYGIDWTVPEPATWHSLDTLDVRLIDDTGEIMRIRWDETTNTFSEFNAHIGEFGAAVQPGGRARFESPELAFLLDDTEVVGSGPTGASVRLNLALRFKPQASGRTFSVEVKASDDEGDVQGWDLVGIIIVP